MFLLVSFRHVGGHPGGHQHCRLQTFFFVQRSQRKRKVNALDFIFQRTPTKKLVGCYSSHLWGWERYARGSKMEQFSSQRTLIHVQLNPTLRTLDYYGQFSLFPEKALTFSFNSICLIRTPIDVENRHFFLVQ